MTTEKYGDVQQARKHLDWLFERIATDSVTGIHSEDWMTAQWSWRQVREALGMMKRPQMVEDCPGCPYQRLVGQSCLKCGTWGNDRV